MRREAAALAFILALPGCALLQPGAERAVTADGVVAEALHASRAPAAEQKAALARAQAAYARDPDNGNRFRLGVLLATLPHPLGDEARAREFLEPLADASAPGQGRLAALLAGQLAERQRAARDLDRVTREAERAARERERHERERASLDKERDKREEALRQQLEALRSIERGILEREEKLRRRQR